MYALAIISGIIIMLGLMALTAYISYKLGANVGMSVGMILGGLFSFLLWKLSGGRLGEPNKNVGQSGKKKK